MGFSCDISVCWLVGFYVGWFEATEWMKVSREIGVRMRMEMVGEHEARMGFSVWIFLYGFFVWDHPLGFLT